MIAPCGAFRAFVHAPSEPSSVLVFYAVRKGRPARPADILARRFFRIAEILRRARRFLRSFLRRASAFSPFFKLSLGRIFPLRGQGCRTLFDSPAWPAPGIGRKGVRMPPFLYSGRAQKNRVKKLRKGLDRNTVIKLANGFKTQSPVQLERLFIESPNSQQPENNDPLRKCIDKLRSAAKSVSMYGIPNSIGK